MEGHVFIKNNSSFPVIPVQNISLLNDLFVTGSFSVHPRHSVIKRVYWLCVIYDVFPFQY